MDYIYSAEEARDKIIGLLIESTGWKYLKSRNCLKKTVKDLVFEINFFSSKWNQSHQSVEMNADFRMIYKKYGSVPVNNIVASVQYLPETKEGWTLSADLPHSCIRHVRPRCPVSLS